MLHTQLQFANNKSTIAMFHAEENGKQHRQHEQTQTIQSGNQQYVLYNILISFHQMFDYYFNHLFPEVDNPSTINFYYKLTMGFTIMPVKWKEIKTHCKLNKMWVGNTFMTNCIRSSPESRFSEHNVSKIQRISWVEVKHRSVFEFFDDKRV